MDSITSNTKVNTGLYAMKKALDSQEHAMINLIENLTAATQATTSPSAEITGIGQNLDVKA